jgi:hypothetical protein
MTAEAFGPRRSFRFRAATTGTIESYPAGQLAPSVTLNRGLSLEHLSEITQ